MPYSFRAFSNLILNQVEPDLFFAAHYHTGMDGLNYRVNGKSISNATRVFIPRNKNLKAPVITNLVRDRENGVVHQITVPTCSYRMGVENMAFGLATLDVNTGDLRYDNLWLPSRFSMLYLYAVTAPICLLLYGIGKRCQNRPSKPRSRKSSRTHEYLKII